MDESMRSERWFAVDLPVLRAIYDVLNRNEVAGLSAIARTVELTEEDVYTSAKILFGAGYIGRIEGSASHGFMSTLGGGDFMISPGQQTEKALRELGAWPTPQGFADLLLERLNRAIEAEVDIERRGTLSRSAEVLKDVLTKTASELLSRVMMGQIPFG